MHKFIRALQTSSSLVFGLNARHVVLGIVSACFTYTSIFAGKMKGGKQKDGLRIVHISRDSQESSKAREIFRQREMSLKRSRCVWALLLLGIVDFFFRFTCLVSSQQDLLTMFFLSRLDAADEV